MTPQPSHPPPSALRKLLTHEASGGLILIASAAAAMAVANSGAAGLYRATLATKVLGLSVLHWINDALMALFFVDGGSGDQARAARRPSFALVAPRAARHRRGRRHGRAGAGLSRVQHAAGRDGARLGYSGRDRHRLLARACWRWPVRACRFRSRCCSRRSRSSTISAPSSSSRCSTAPTCRCRCWAALRRFSPR